MPVRTKEFYERQNRIMEKLASIVLSPNENKYCWALFRKTFGYGKYEDRISRGQYSSMTKVREEHISHVRTRLKKRNIIHKNGDIEGFNLNTDQWGIVQVSALLEIVQVSALNSAGRAEKKSAGIGTYKETTKKSSKEGQNFYKKLSEKEINKLELDQWYRAIMFNQGKFSIFYIEGTIDDYPFKTRMSCWYRYVEAVNVKDKEAFFSYLLRNHQEEE